MRSLEPAVALRSADMAEELAGVGYWWMDAITETIRWSPNMFKIYGLDLDHVPSLDFAMQFVHPDDRGAAESRLANNLSGGSARSSTRIVRPSGEIRFIEGRNACEHGPGGEIVAIYGTVLDVTDRVAAEQALAESEYRYRLLAENSPDVTACCRPDGTFSFLTSGIRNLLGFEVAELIGRKAFDIIHPDDRSRVRQAFVEHMKQGRDAPPLRYEYRAIAKDGREVWLEANPSSVFDPATGALVEVQDVLRDITARKALDRQLLAAKEAAEAAAAVKAEFMANISHELRTPLTAIIGYSTLLAETSHLGDDARRHTDQVASASRILLSLVNGILDFSRLEAGQLTVSARTCSPTQLAQECLDLLALAAAAKGVRLEYFQAEGVPAAVLIDPDAYRQVLVNLIGNAVKFTDAGHVRVSVEFNSTRNELCVSVHDTGAGIAPDDIRKLFRRFSQVDGTSTRTHGGAGLGLAISKGLVEAMGGGISVLSEPGVGSIFSFRIPATSVEFATAESHGIERPAPGARILVVDDNPQVRELVRAVLESCGSEITEAVDGVAAVELAMAEPFDLILLDLHMPRLSGQEVAAALRSRRGPNHGIPIVAFTASDESINDEACRRYGFDAVLAKPVAVGDLLSMVARYAGGLKEGWAA
jgi:PAS domain S-box-containing protein